jgi:hypothetical protein
VTTAESCRMICGMVDGYGEGISEGEIHDCMEGLIAQAARLRCCYGVLLQ